MTDDITKTARDLLAAADALFAAPEGVDCITAVGSLPTAHVVAKALRTAYEAGAAEMRERAAGVCRDAAGDALYSQRSGFVDGYTEAAGLCGDAIEELPLTEPGEEREP